MPVELVPRPGGPAGGDVDEPAVRAAGEQVLLLDTKQRRYLVTLKAGGEFHTHAGFVAARRAHRSARGHHREVDRRARRTRALRPTLADFVVEMPRGAQVIYPKDLGPICMLADIVPGDGCSSPASARARCR